MSTAPLTLRELAAFLAAIGGFETRPRIAVGVSGGPDSLALILLADRWARQRGGQATALIVDHGLRPESGGEVLTVAGWLAARAIPHEILHWTGDKPTSGIQAAARDARYRLLAEWCRVQGVLHLLTAHHREDQAETHLIRRRAGSGVDGLAGMSAVRELPGCRLVRPLLAVPKARFAALLATERQPFLHDPSNMNLAFARARLRAMPAVLTGAALDAIVAETRACGRQRIDREAALDRLIGGAVAVHPGGFVALDRAALATADAELAGRLLGRVALCVGGARRPLRRDRIARLRAALVVQPDRARTLGGCRFVPWRGRILVLRELAAASPPVRLDPGIALLWDRRFGVAPAAGAGGPFVLGYLGSQAAPALRHAALPCGGLPRLAYPVLPVFRDDRGLAAVPHLDYRRPGVGELPRLRFCSTEPLTRARFTVV